MTKPLMLAGGAAGSTQPTNTNTNSQPKSGQPQVTVQTSDNGFGLRYRNDGFEASGSVTTRGAATQLDAQAKAKVGFGTVEGAVRTIQGGPQDGTLLARVSVASNPPDPNAPVSGWYRFGVGYAHIPDLFEPMSAGRSAIAGTTAGKDWSVNGPVAMVGGGVQAKVELAPQVTLEAGASAELNVFVPLEHDADAKEKVKWGNNGAFPFDGGTMMAYSDAQLRTHVALEAQSPDGAQFGVRFESQNALSPMQYLNRGLPGIPAYLFANQTLSGEFTSADGKLNLYGSVPLATTVGAVPQVGGSLQLDPVTLRAQVGFSQQPSWAAGLSADLGQQTQLDVDVASGNGSTSVRVGMSIGLPEGQVPAPLPKGPDDPTLPSAPTATPDSYGADLLPPNYKSMTYDELRRHVQTPEQVAALMNLNNMDYIPGGLQQQIDAWSPELTVAAGGGVCVNIHVLGASLLQPQYEAVAANFYNRTVAHTVLAYKDAEGWNVIQYGSIFRVGAPTATDAVLAVFPEAARLELVDPNSLATTTTWRPFAKDVSDFFNEGASEPESW